MPRRSKQIWIQSFNNARQKKNEPDPELIPILIVRGVIRGLLKIGQHNGLNQDRCEKYLMALVINQAKLLGANFMNLEEQGQYVAKIAEFVRVPLLMQASHSEFIMKRHADLIMEAIRLNGYQAVKHPGSRACWLNEKVPGILKEMKKTNICFRKCPARDSANRTFDETSSLARRKGEPELLHWLLGHHHGVSTEYVRAVLHGRKSPLKTLKKFGSS